MNFNKYLEFMTFILEVSKIGNDNLNVQNFYQLLNILEKRKSNLKI